MDYTSLLTVTGVIILILKSYDSYHWMYHCWSGSKPSARKYWSPGVQLLGDFEKIRKFKKN